jgi:hypothetical protein
MGGKIDAARESVTSGTIARDKLTKACEINDALSMKPA